MVNSIAVEEAQVTVLAPRSPGYRFIAISNNGSSAAYLMLFQDDSALTTSNGIVLQPGSAILLDQDDSPILNNGIYAICAETQSTTLAVQAY
jgi:hypothetical protein